MHIAFDAKRAFSNNTGLGNYSRFTINALCSAYPQHTYTLYTPSVKDKGLYKAPLNATICTPGSAWSKQLKSYWRSYGIVKRLENDGVEIFHGLSNEIPFGINKTPVKSIVTIHDLIFLRQPELYKPIDQRIYQKKAKYAVEAADRIIAISQQTADDLIELLHAEEKKIRIVYQGCHPWFYDKASKDRKKEIRKKYHLPNEYILYVGTIEKRKNLLTLIKALHKFGIKTPLVAVGKKTAYFKEIEKYIEGRKIKNIHFHHHIHNEDLPVFYQEAEVFVLPSTYEGFGIPILEALNSGTAVITSKGGCLEETAGPGALLVDPNNTEEMAAAIREILEKPETREKLILDGKKHALKFREENTVKSLYQVYKELSNE